MSLLRRLINFATDPEVIARFQKACGIVHYPDLTEFKEERSCNGDISRHQNGLAGGVQNGKTSPINGISKRLENGIDVDKLHMISENGTHIKHRNGLVKNGEMGKPVNGVVRTGTVPYRIENRFCFYLFSFGSGLGNAFFYICFYSFCVWNFDFYVTRRICLVWCIAMYFGQMTKDLLRVPRPKSPPVVRLETRYELEYGMPSTHAIVGTVIPFTLVIFTSGRYEYPVGIGVIVAVLWCFLVLVSRVYLGMHNFLDVLGGVLYAVVIMVLTLPFIDSLDTFLTRHPLSPVVLISLPIVLTLLYPALEKWNTCRGDTTLILSINSGMYFGVWVYQYQGLMTTGPTELPFSVSLGWSLLLYSALRFISGLSLTVTTLTVVKLAVFRSVCFLFKMDPKDSMTKQKLVMELPYKFFSYFSVAFFTAYTAPLMFVYLGIPRPSFFTEL